MNRYTINALLGYDANGAYTETQVVQDNEDGEWVRYTEAQLAVSGYKKQAELEHDRAVKAEERVAELEKEVARLREVAQSLEMDAAQAGSVMLSCEGRMEREQQQIAEALGVGTYDTVEDIIKIMEEKLSWRSK